MMRQAIPLFQDAHILRKSMLEALSDHAYLAGQLLYKDWGDGILSGCRLTTTEDDIILNEGIVFYAGEMVLIKEPMATPYYPTDTTTVLKLRISDKTKEENFISRRISLALTGEEELGRCEFELCRFKLQKGAKLRSQYQDFEDRSTEFDTLNTIHAAYAAKGGSTLSPEILKAFAEEMLEAGGLSDFDAMFCVQLLGQERQVCAEALSAYVGHRDKKKLRDISNAALYRELARILKEVKRGERAKGGGNKKRWKIMVE